VQGSRLFAFTDYRDFFVFDIKIGQVKRVDFSHPQAELKNGVTS